MLAFVGSNAGDRKLRLFGVACCRRIWDEMWEGCHPGVEAAEQLAEGIGGPNALRQAALVSMNSPDAERAALDAAEWVLGGDAFMLNPDDPLQQAEANQQAQLFRDIIGNPFHPVTLDACWRTPTVLSLARGIYTDRAWDRLPILADSLCDAGCDDPELLGHLRGPGPHVRGCWVLDLVLGKE